MTHSKPSPDDLKQLAPTGKLRGGVVVAPAASAFFAIKDDKGEPHGVTVDLLRAFSAALKPDPTALRPDPTALQAGS